MQGLEQRLPEDVLSRASLRGSEYAWHPDHLSDIVAAAQTVGLATCAGTFQYRIPIGTCELYWIDFDNYDRIDRVAPWDEIVRLTGGWALEAIETLRSTFDFEAEGVRAFKDVMALRDAGTDVSQYECFVLYFETAESLRTLDNQFSRRK